MLRQAEVEYLDAASGHDDYVGSLQVAMDHTAFVRVRHSVGDLLAVADHRLHGKAIFRNLLGQRTPADEFHYDVTLAVGFAHVIDGANIGMVQRGGCTRLANQKRASVFVVVQFIGKELQGYVATQPVIMRAIDHAHPAGTDFFDDSVMRDGLVTHVWSTLKRAS